MFGVSGRLALGLCADKKKLSLLSLTAAPKRCEAERDNASKRYTRWAFSPTDPLVAVASNGGSIQVIDTRTGKVSLRLTADSGDVAALGLTSTSLFAAVTQTGEVIEWELESGKEKSRFVADEEGLSCMAVLENDEDDPLIATGRTSITVWRGQKRVSKYSGHQSNISSMVFLEGGALASGNQQDRFVSVWPANTKKARHPIMTLTCKEPPRILVRGPRFLEGDEASILALSSAGNAVFVWRIPSISDGADVPPTSTSCTITTSSEVGSIMGCDFSNDSSGAILCLVQKSDDLDPALVKTSITSATSEGGLLSEVKISFNSTDDSVPQPVGNGVFTEGKSQSSKLKRLDRTATVLNTSSSDADAKRIRATSTGSAEDDRPLMTRLLEFSGRFEQEQQALHPGRISAPTSLSVALEQALQTEDNEKIEAVLQTGDADIVSQTVHRLSPLKVPSLIRQLATKLQGKPGRAVNLIVWINAIMEHHAALLTTDESAREALRSVYAVADARVQMFDRLLRLKGRLDLILARTGTGQSASSKQSMNGPLVVFDASH